MIIICTIREFITTWATGVRDPKSGVAHYHGILEAYYEWEVGWSFANKTNYRRGTSAPLANTCEFSPKNHTAEFIYVAYDPTGLFLEYACLFAKCFPRKIPLEHLNYESGGKDTAQIELEFSTIKYESSTINDIAIWYTQNSKILWNYLDFNPEQNGTGSTNRYYGSIGSDPNPNPRTYDYGNYTTNYKENMVTLERTKISSSVDAENVVHNKYDYNLKTYGKK